MSYKQRLGKVKGDKGKVYLPSIKTIGNKRYITWTLQEESASVPNDIDITPKVYLPSIDSNGNVSFTLADNTNATIPTVNIKGPQGPPGAVNTNVCTDLPPKSQAKEGVIYIHDGGIATVYDVETGEFYDLDNLIKFNDYYTKSESNERFYTKTEIENMFGSIVACQNAVIHTLDKNSINIPSGD